MGKKSYRKIRPVNAAPAVLPPPGLELPAAPASPLVNWIWVLAAVLCIWACGFTTMRGSDLYWHLAAGDWMAKHGGFLTTDPWSFTQQGQPWLNDAWLSDRIYHHWVALFGIEALVWWKWGVLMAAFLLLMQTLRRLTGSMAASFISTVFGIVVAEAFLDIRPHVGSLLGYSILLHLTVGRERPSAWLPLLFLVWVQMHAIFVFGLMALAVLLAPSVLWGTPEERRRSVILGFVSALVCLVNPNFITVFTRPLRYALDPTSPFRSIGEWQPPFVPDGIVSWIYPYAIGIFILGACFLLVRRWSTRHSQGNLFIGLALGALVVVGLAVLQSVDSRRVTPDSGSYDLAIKLSLGIVVAALVLESFKKQRDISYAGLALGALTLAMSLRSRRFVPLFGISQALLLAPAITPLCQALWQRWSRAVRAPRRAMLAAPLLAVVLGVYWLWPYPLRSYAFHYLMAEDTFPVETVNFMELNGISGKIFSYYNWGGYLHLRTQGALKVYIDGRADMVFSDQVYLNYVRVLGLQPGWKQIVEGSGAEYVLWPKNDPRVLRELVKSGDWRVLYEDAVSTLLIPARKPVPSMKPTPDSAWRQLALGMAAMNRNQPVEAAQHYEAALKQMPHLSMACYDLARIKAIQGDIPGSRATVQHCQDVFPYPGKVEWFEAFLKRLGQAKR